MFVKRGGENDGKILAVIEEDELDEKQKRAAKQISTSKVKSENSDDITTTKAGS